MDKVLSALTVSSIKKISQACGSKLTGKKSEIIQALQATTTTFSKSAHKPVRLISLDPGVVNLGVTQVLIPAIASVPSAPPAVPVIERCYRDAINVDPKSSNPEFADATVEFLTKLLNTKNDIDFVIIEQQRSRTAGGASIPTAVLRANILEGMLFAVLRASYPQIEALSVSPKAVVNYWSKLDTKGAKRTYAMSKAVRRNLIDSWLTSGTQLQFGDQSVCERLRTLEGKRDDAHDSLVQAITWARWRRNANALIQAITKGSDPLECLTHT